MKSARWLSIIAGLAVASCQQVKDTGQHAEVVAKAAFDKAKTMGTLAVGLELDRLQGKVKMAPGELYAAQYADQVTFIRVAPKPRTWETFPDVRLRRANVGGDWLLDSDYYEKAILKKLNATQVDVALPAALVVADGPGALKGTYQRQTRIRAQVGRKIFVFDVAHPRVTRQTVDEPWCIDRTALKKQLRAIPSSVFVVFPLSD